MTAGSPWIPRDPQGSPQAGDLHLEGHALLGIRDRQQLREVVDDDADPTIGTLPGRRALGELLHLGPTWQSTERGAVVWMVKWP